MRVEKDGKIGLIEVATGKEIRVTGVTALEIIVAEQRTGEKVYVLASEIDAKVAKQTKAARDKAIKDVASESKKAEPDDL